MVLSYPPICTIYGMFIQAFASWSLDGIVSPSNRYAAPLLETLTAELARNDVRVFARALIVQDGLRGAVRGNSFRLTTYLLQGFENKPFSMDDLDAKHVHRVSGRAYSLF